MGHLRYLVIAMVVLVAACDNVPPAHDAKSEAPAPAKEETAAPLKKDATVPSKAPAEEPMPQAVAKDTETVTNDACVAALSKQTKGGVIVVSNEFSEASTLVMLSVGANNAPWKCLVSNDGVVQDLEFEGNDGDGVPEELEQPAASSSDVSQVAIDACVEAVKGETGEADLAVLSTEFSEANSLIMVGVGSGRAPWKCLVSDDGSVAEVSFAGDEGAL